MQRLVAASLFVFCFAAVGRPAGGDQPETKWRDAGRVVTIFGSGVNRPGFYELTDRPVSLLQVAVSAGFQPGKSEFVILQRTDGKGAKRIQVDASRLKEDGDIPLQANDVIEVTAK